MSRTVSYAIGATVVCYRDVSDFEVQYEWEEFIFWVRECAQECWKSLYETDKWIGSEDNAILENQHCHIGVSEYCGLASIWLLPRDDNGSPDLASFWCSQIEEKFKRLFGEYAKVATFSNGEAYYKRIN